MATRVCGRVRVDITWTGRDYDCALRVGNESRSKVVLGVPPTQQEAVDAPEVYDRVARAAISHGIRDRLIDENECDFGVSGALISRSAPKPRRKR